MTLCLVRWPHLTASLVRAENEEELLEILDSAGNPDGCDCDTETGEATVRLGDAGWQAVHRVVDGEPQNVHLTEAERTWIRACWLATAPLRKNRT